MIIGPFMVQCRPEHAEEMARTDPAVQAPSLALPGVVHFDVARSLTDPKVFVVTEVYDDRAALGQRNQLAEVARVLDLANAGALVGDYEWTVWESTPA